MEEGQPALGGRWVIFRVPSNPNHATIPQTKKAFVVLPPHPSPKSEGCCENDGFFFLKMMGFSSFPFQLCHPSAVPHARRAPSPAHITRCRLSSPPTSHLSRPFSPSSQPFPQPFHGSPYITQRRTFAIDTALPRSSVA